MKLLKTCTLAITFCSLFQLTCFAQQKTDLTGMWQLRKASYPLNQNYTYLKLYHPDKTFYSYILIPNSKGIISQYGTFSEDGNFLINEYIEHSVFTNNAGRSEIIYKMTDPHTMEAKFSTPNGNGGEETWERIIYIPLDQLKQKE